MRLRMICFLAVSFALGSSIPSFAGETAEKTAFDLDTTVLVHLNAVRNRDLETLVGTLTTGEELTLILPGGTVFETRKEFVELHREWFADTGWTISFETLAVRETTELATVWLRTTIEDATPASGRQTYLTLVFAKESAGWRLVFDQNTRIGPPR